MATSTSHLGLVKPAYTDAADVAVINNNMDTIDTAISNILPVITGSTNNSGYTIATGHYFEANGSVYKATASIGVGSSWSGSASAVSGTALNEAVTSLSSNIAKLERGLTYVENGDTIAANAAYTAGKFICWQGEMYRIKAPINATVTSGNWTTYLDKMDGMGGALSQINADLTSLNDSLAPHWVTVSAGTNISFDDVKCYTLGRICVLNARVNVTGHISAGGNILLTGLPKAMAIVKIAVHMNNGYNKAVQITQSGTLIDDWSGFDASTGFFVSVTYVIAKNS